MPFLRRRRRPPPPRAVVGQLPLLYSDLCHLFEFVIESAFFRLQIKIPKKLRQLVFSSDTPPLFLVAGPTREKRRRRRKRPHGRSRVSRLCSGGLDGLTNKNYRSPTQLMEAMGQLFSTISSPMQTADADLIDQRNNRAPTMYHQCTVVSDEKFVSNQNF